MSDKVEMPDDADCRNCSDSDPGAWHALDKHCWNAASEESQRLIETEALLPASGGPERDYEPGTRFVVVEIPPAASDKEADEITEKVFEAAYDIDAQYTGPWDLFIYRQHNAPPANIPAAGGPTVDRQERYRLAWKSAYRRAANFRFAATVIGRQYQRQQLVEEALRAPLRRIADRQVIMRVLDENFASWATLAELQSAADALVAALTEQADHA